MKSQFLSDQDIADSVAVAAQLAQHYAAAGMPEEQMLLDLHGVRSKIESELVEDVGPAIATIIAQAFVAAVVCHRRELEGRLLH